MTMTLYIVGDSTAALKGAIEKPMTGWGEYLQQHLDPAIRVDNRAINGRSTRSFIAEGRWAAVENELQPGDYVFIQFGHNDQKQEDPSRFADPAPGGEYRTNLKRFIESSRSRGAIPVLLTSVSRRRFTAEGLPDPDAVGPYPEAMRETARETGAPLLDLFAASQQLYHRMGQEESKHLFMHLPAGSHPNYPDGTDDDTHFSDRGAREIAGLAAETIRQCEALPGLHPLLRNLAPTS
ncbi:rhamnogalacturonan acetylesterase [Paenibacillus sp. OAE614]|uniref:rhamnogalacturonan acetylesterase n=1 Tax=Paenibacillus sp. OAE614 TaxID=2663804 RepID=UPI001789DC93